MNKVDEQADGENERGKMNTQNYRSRTGKMSTYDRKMESIRKNNEQIKATGKMITEDDKMSRGK